MKLSCSYDPHFLGSWQAARSPNAASDDDMHDRNWRINSDEPKRFIHRNLEHRRSFDRGPRASTTHTSSSQMNPPPPGYILVGVCWVVIPCSLQDGCQCFEGTFCLHLLRVDPAAMFLRNAGIHHRDLHSEREGGPAWYVSIGYGRYHGPGLCSLAWVLGEKVFRDTPENLTLNIYRCEILKIYIFFFFFGPFPLSSFPLFFLISAKIFSRSARIQSRTSRIWRCPNSYTVKW
jgi:hypothetical protein